MTNPVMQADLVAKRLKLSSPAQFYQNKAQIKLGTYTDIINAAAQRHNIDPALIAAVIKQESASNPRAISHKGAVGLMQIMPATASTLGVHNLKDLLNPEINIHIGAKYLAEQLRTFGNLDLALAAYNAGPGAVKKYGNTIPPYRETRRYVSKVTNYYQEIKK
ncbi:lytic transglycosylase domain-containing protein [Suttonella ornithocola]|uniref:Soluble lytic murein transglycosylase n=1 Tax=Suttonella ornithocola TaxID=279832 RepID=A0A380MVP8_9GAMM|nr:lytic transglycosylase domain-containing protein [Suttonella ornithocola]SUO96650.1 Soluble lytic murein transglycosylase precursor [Suttonella ornithocola]